MQGEVCFFFLSSCISFYGFSEKMDVSQTYHGNHFTKYVNQASMLYVLDLHSDNETIRLIIIRVITVICVTYLSVKLEENWAIPSDHVR